jgi:hypothetical protein
MDTTTGDLSGFDSIRLDFKMSLFPETGHHLAFRPIVATKEVDDDLSNVELPGDFSVQGVGNIPPSALREIFFKDEACLNDQKRWHPDPESIDSDTDATAGQPKPNTPNWIKARFGHATLRCRRRDLPQLRQVEFFGVWVAVDTAIGDSSRGLFFTAQEPPSPIQQQRYAGKTSAPSPYLADANASPKTLSGVKTLKLCTKTKLAVIITLYLEFKQPDSPNKIEVDLIVDMGNTRTAVVALEHHSELRDRELATYCHPIPILSPKEVFTGHGGFSADKARVITDSYLLLHEPLFAGAVLRTEHPEFEEREEKRFLRAPTVVRSLRRVLSLRPHQFCDFSPAWLGEAAFIDVLRHFEPDARDQGRMAAKGRMTVSSPKRYGWDSDTADVGRSVPLWYMWRNKWSDGSAAKLAGEVLALMPMGGGDWPLIEPPNGKNVPPPRRPATEPEKPVYPRSDAITWMALRILEESHRIINSREWRAGNREHAVRRLRRVVVTYPPGWTRDEFHAYRSKWEKAVNVLSWTRFINPGATIRDGGDAPRLEMSIDEAFAAQLPIVLSEISRFGDRGQDWIELVGRGKGNASKVRVMSIDIGGGTTDLCIVDYQDTQPGSSTNLQCSLSFKDSSSVAGDELRKDIIESQLVPLMGERGGIDKIGLQELFGSRSSTQSEEIQHAIEVRAVLLPIINRWLDDSVHNRSDRFKFEEVAETEYHFRCLESLNSRAKAKLGVEILPDAEEDLTFGNLASKAVDRSVRRCFRRLFESAAKLAAAAECDLVIVSGKPSELPEVKCLLRDALAMPIERIIFATDFNAGGLWPFNPAGRIDDAKQVTVVGAALYQAAGSGLLKGIRLDIRPSAELENNRFQSQWGPMPKQGGTKFRPAYLEPGQEKSSEIAVMVNTRIGRKMLPMDSAAPEPVYELRWRDPALRNNRGNEPVNVVFGRTSTGGQGESGGIFIREGLKILKATGTRMEPNSSTPIPVTESDLELKLNTLHDGYGYWLDTGRLEVAISDSGDD